MAVMSRESMIFLFGILVILTSFLGVSRDIKQYIFIVIGALLLFLGFSLRRSAYMRSIEGRTGEYSSALFHESRAGKGRTPQLSAERTERTEHPKNAL